MNLFVLAVGVKEAAKAHGDKHVVKMLLEACQMLYTAHWTSAHAFLTDGKRRKWIIPLPESMTNAPRSKNGERGYKCAHVNHPCTKWIREKTGNYIWAASLAVALADEYEYRWPGRKHSCRVHAEWLLENVPDISKEPRTDFAIAMDDIYKVGKNPIASYRNYYKKQKVQRGLAVYTNRKIPSFITEYYSPISVNYLQTQV